MKDNPKGASAVPGRWRRILKRLAWVAVGLVAVGGVAFGIAYWRSSNECDDGSKGAPGNPMMAVTYCDYGGPEVLRVGRVEKPAPKDDEVLVRVRAAAINPLDWHVMRGTPYLMRLLGAGLRKPKSIQLGVDFSGTVEAAGKNVTGFKPGDDVFGGAGGGALAEFVVVNEARAALKPASVSFEQAASVPIAALTALQGLRDKGRLKAGERVLINGASGGVGTFAVQIAKAMGADVTGVCGGRNVEMVRSLGADHVFDYTKEDFTLSGGRYDLVIDNVGVRPTSEFRRVLTPHGRFVVIGGGGLDDQGMLGPLGRIFRLYVSKPFVSHEIGFLFANINRKDLAVLAEMIQSGKVTPVIDRRYRLNEIAVGMAYLEAGHARGKVIIALD